jgi:hypothetical protein
MELTAEPEAQKRNRRNHHDEQAVYLSLSQQLLVPSIALLSIFVVQNLPETSPIIFPKKILSTGTACTSC